MRRTAALAALALSGCGTFIALGDEYERRCDTIRTVFADLDGDGEGNPSASAPYCGETPPLGYVTNATDCDDADPLKNGKVPDDECDGIDQNCDGLADNGFLPSDCFRIEEAAACLGRLSCKGGETICAPRWFVDGDGDGHGSKEMTPSEIPYPDQCPFGSMGKGAAGLPDDCNDGDETIFPKKDAEDSSIFAELCDDPFAPADDDCDGPTGRMYLYEPFSQLNLSTVDTPFDWWSPANSEWTIRAASNACGGPTSDATPNTVDNRVLGLDKTGACIAPGLGGQVFSPTIDTSEAQSLYLIFSYWVNSETIDKKPGTLSVWIRQGAVLSFLRSYTGAQAEWLRDSIDITAYRGNATTLVFSYEIGADPAPGPVLDDIRITDDLCEMP